MLCQASAYTYRQCLELTYAYYLSIVSVPYAVCTHHVRIRYAACMRHVCALRISRLRNVYVICIPYGQARERTKAGAGARARVCAHASLYYAIRSEPLTAYYASQVERTCCTLSAAWLLARAASTR